MSNVGFRIYQHIPRPSKHLIDSFANIPVSNIADTMNRTFCIGDKIRAYNSASLVGTAFTVKTRPGDNLILNKAIDMASPGDVIVIEAKGDTSNALIGELMITWAQKRGISGFVIDGAIRDVNHIRNMTIPVYAAGVTPAGPYKDGPGEINTPISCGGVTVHPGDILVGDQDGIVVINPKDAPRVLERGLETVAKEEQVMADIKNGTWDRAWIDEMLHKKGCEILD
ncbi:RraA family protein (plasmid) [Priestia megaterium]|uniref:RraA family protein n=1 Tax=Priestia megaterium TaxID=1404 RepID=UPI000BF44791|nr:RraA family protein [Priestia megaterium]MDH2449715.1 RraA family protein [Priestia megaterium]MDL5149173.1 RraA family protein [Priestia megaterium]PER65261.1 methyltransferase [Priestia megaterium]PGQ87627.1 methyltransferase [Priestia megaterium]